MADYDNTIVSFDFSPFPLADSAPLFVPSFGASEVFINKVWDPGGPEWVYWETSSIDSTGQYYPDPHATGFSGCSGFRLAGIKYE